MLGQIIADGTGVMYEVRLEIMFWDQYSRLFSREKPVQLFDGSRLITEGEIAGCS